MSKRRSTATSDSLDLLLDTICNTFGAVIFISILVSVLVGQAVDGDDQSLGAVEAAMFVRERQENITAARARLQTLNIQFDQQNRIINSLSTDTSRELASEILQASSNQLQLSQQRVTAVDRVTTLQGESLVLTRELEQQAEELKKTQQENVELKALLERTIDHKSRTAKITRLRRTTKQSVVFMLHQQRLFRAVTPDGDIDDKDCLENMRLQTLVITPRPGAGVAVNLTNEPVVAKAFNGIRKNDHFVRLFVSRDSFAEFQPLRNLLIRLGFEYEIILFSEGKAELYLAPSETESFVQ